MRRPSAGLGVSAFAALVCACNSGPPGPVPLASGGSSPASGGSSGAGTGGTGSGGGGYSGVWTGQCDVIDGELAYGPIGERKTLQVDMREIYGFPAPDGYTLLWLGSSASAEASSNFVGAHVNVDFLGGMAQALSAEIVSGTLDVTPAPDGFVAATCTPTGQIVDSEVAWIPLSADLGPLPNLWYTPAVASCRDAAIVWTGQRFLTSFADVRGVLVASLDEDGDLMGEQVISAQADTPPNDVRFSQNGDRVLLAFDGPNADEGSIVVLDLEGVPLGDVTPAGRSPSGVDSIALGPHGDGWLLASGSGAANAGLLISMISRDGVVLSETLPSAVPSGSSVTVAYLNAMPSRYGGSVVIGEATLHDGFAGGQYRQTYVIDDAGQPVYFGGHDDSDYFPVGLIPDPNRDLILERHRGIDGVAQPVTVQEYGCLE